MASITYRFLLAAGASWLYCLYSGRLMRFGILDHGFMLLQGASLFCFNYLLIYICELTLISGLVALIFSTIVVMNMMNGSFFLKNRFEFHMGLGACIGLMGMVLVFWPEISDFETGSENLIAVALAILGTFSASVGNIVSARNQRHGIPVIESNTYGMTYGALIMLTLSLITGQEFSFEMTASYVGSLLFLAFFATIIAFLSYLTLLGRVGVDRGAYASLIFPLVALGISTVVEGYQWSTYAGIGIALIVTGNLLILKRGTRGISR
tara:strand:+ start:188 stop:985 length:798 start_codon:yes stop_codon:yes gene_type:complete